VRSPAAWILGGPGLSLKRRLERRVRDAAGVVRDRRRGDRGNYFEEVIFAETGREESFDVLMVEPPALFDHRFRQSRQRGEFAVLWQTTVTRMACTSAGSIPSLSAWRKAARV
jgi:hypothetical protein